MKSPTFARLHALGRHTLPVLALAGLAIVTRLCMLGERSAEAAGNRVLALFFAFTPIALALLAGALFSLWVIRAGRAAEEQRRRAETVLLEQRFSSLEQYSNDIVMLLSPDGAILDANDRAEEAYGHSREELRKLHVSVLRVPAARPMLPEQLRAASRGPLRVRAEHLRRDGTPFPVEVSARPMEIFGRLYIQAIGRDVTERVEMERKLRESEARFRRIAENAHDAIFRYRLYPRRGFDFVSPSILPITGYGAEELATDGDPWERLVHPEDRPALADLAAVEGKPTTLRWVRRDGSYAWIEQVITLERNEAGDIVALEGIARDITERRHLEARLQLADRLVAVGTLAAGVAHEINNPLSYVASNLTFVQEQLAQLFQHTEANQLRGAAEEMRRALKEAAQGADRVKEIVQGLRQFSHLGAGTRGPVDVRCEIEATVALARNEICHRAQLQVDIEELLPVHAGHHEIGQVVLNLLVNAAHAIPEGNVSRNQIRVSARTDPRRRVIIEVRDTGAGISRENLRRIFDPFFTTKQPGQGTGLGLSISMGIVTCIGGTIEVESEVGRGSLFRVILPSVSDTTPSPEPSQQAPPNRHGRVLVVDDEPLVGRAVARLLRSDHTVESFTSPAEVLRRVAAGERWDVVLCDMMMPEMDGPTLATRMAEVAPEMADRVVFMTGGAFTESARAFLAADARPSVEKPVDASALRAVVAQRMAAAERSTPAG